MSDLFGLDIQPVNDEVTPLEAIVILKGFDEDGNVALYPRMTEGLSHWEAIGMLSVEAARLQTEMVGQYVDEADTDG